MRLAWSISALFHGTILTLAVAFNLHAPSLPVQLQKEPFRWDVSLMAAPQADVYVADSPESQESATSSAVDTRQAVDEPSAEPASQSLPQSIKPIQDSEISQPALMSARTSARQQVSPRSGAQSVDADTAAAMSVPSPSQSVLPPHEVESRSESSLVQVATELEHLAVLQRPQPIVQPAIHRPVRPDYGWLMDQLRARLEQVKTYPRLAKTNHMQGRVVVLVSVESDGRLVNLRIEESSGYPALDRAALEALLAASPLTLAHGLQSDRVAMSVPISYRLE